MPRGLKVRVRPAAEGCGGFVKSRESWELGGLSGRQLSRAAERGVSGDGDRTPWAAGTHQWTLWRQHKTG